MRTAILALLFLTACTPTPPASETPTSATSAQLPAPTPGDVQVRITAAQNGQTVEVGVNQRFAIELVGVPTAGYVWEPTSIPAFITRAGDASGNTTAAQSQPGFTGGNHWEVEMFAATGPGTGEIVMEQRRPWETTEPASDTFRVTITAR